MRGSRRKLPGAEGKPLAGYAPLAAIVVLFVAATTVLPSTVPEGLSAGGVTEVEEGRAASGWGDSVRPCTDGRQRQVEGDPYSPPCFTFEGANGGATTRGVTEDEITVSFRVTPEPNIIATFAAVAGIDYEETNQVLADTTAGLVDYFNENFQMYGRRLRFVQVDGTGSLVEEIFGAGQAEANNDALRVGTEVEAFADLSALSQPYADALARQHVISFGAPYLSREWFTDRRPYAWSLLADCSVIAETGTEYSLQRLLGRPATWAGGDLQGRERKVGLIAPDNPEYQQCVAAAERVIGDAGEEIDLVLDYNLELANLQPQAATLLARLKREGITTVQCTCDPLMILYLTRVAETQDYQPEWNVLGAGFSDLDLVAQAYNLPLSGDQWTRAFGLSYASDPLPREENPAYQAYRSVRDDEPSKLVDLLYYQLYSLVIGIQMAGPDLTPQNFETGMFAYPEATGPAGTWDWRPDHYTPQVDAREIWFDPERVSPFNDDQGSYVGGPERYRQGDWPEGDPEVFPR
jgi:hypothetical protein